MTVTDTQPEAPVETQGEVVENYWGTDETHTHMLPDGKQYFEFRIMNEGDKAKFQKLTNQDFTIKQGGEAKVRMDPAAERHTLIKTSVTGWNLYMPEDLKDRNSRLVPTVFSAAMLNNWLELAPPKIVEELELAIRKANPWMQSEMTVEMIEAQIKELEELRRDKIAAEAGEASSANK